MKYWAALIFSTVAASRAHALARVPRVDPAPLAARSALGIDPSFARASAALPELGAAPLPAVSQAAAGPAAFAEPTQGASALETTQASASNPAASPARGARAREEDATLSSSPREAARLFDGAAAPSEWGPDWRRGYFEAADGTRLSYLHRPGAGRAVLFVHGRSLGAESFLGLQDSFPGRPLMLLERRGYGESAVGAVDERTLGAVQTEDVKRAAAVARSLGDGGRIGVLGYSLGAMIQPEFEPGEVAWLALVNPGVPDMVQHFSPMAQTAAQMFRLGYDAAKLFFPWQREEFIRAVADWELEEFRGRLAELSGDGREALGRRLISDLERRMSVSRLRELWIQETLWAGFGQKSPAARRVPTLVYLNDADETVPRSAIAEHLETLRREAPALEVVREPGGHLAPVFEPRTLRLVLERFDAKHSESAPLAPR